MKNKIKELVENNQKELVSLVRDLVAISSETGHEAQIIDWLEKKFHEIGFDEIVTDKMGNLIGKLGTGKEVLVIDGHVDTVKLGSLENWNFDPLKGKLEDGKIFGRGSCDQKGGVASSITAALILKEIGIPKNVTLYVVCSILEESFEGMNLQYIIDNGLIKPNIVILTEPTNLAIAIGHRGRCDLSITAKGISSHGSEPDKGENAIYKMNEIITELEHLHDNLPINSLFGKNTLAVTKIVSEAVSMNAIPDSCTIWIDHRIGQHDTLETILHQIKHLPSVEKYNAEVQVVKISEKTYTNYEFTKECFYPCWKLEENHPFVEIAKTAYERQFGMKPQIRHWRFSTNGVATKGLFNIPTMGFGPGNEVFAHTANEQIPITHLVAACEFYIAFVLEWAKKMK